jgi:uncharacterized protein YndB with AHSA1/START domain
MPEERPTILAHASVIVSAPRHQVWGTLVHPETVRHIMPVTEVISEWRAGSPFVWRFEMQGASYEVTGMVLRFDVGRLLEYDYLDPLDVKHRADNRHRVTIELTDEGAATRVSVVQDNNATKAALAHAEGGWRLALNNLKALVEGARE